MERLLRIEEVAQQAGLSSQALFALSDQALYRAIRERQLPAVKIGRKIRLSERVLREWLNGQAQNTQPQAYDQGLATAV